VKVGGLTIDEAGNTLTEALRQFEKHVVITVRLRESSGRAFTVNGAVEKPGAYTLNRPTRLSDALAQAGGVRSQVVDGELVAHGDLAGAKLVRNGRSLPVSLSEALQGASRHDAYLHPGDIIFVPGLQGKHIIVLGEVKKATALRYRRGMRLSEALARAGGLSDDADDADVRIVRGSLARPQIYRASLEDVVDGKRPDVLLAPGDVVFVTEHWFASATDVIKRLSPLLATVGAVALLSK
jgi:polysaccharide export outer membrane protein